MTTATTPLERATPTEVAIAAAIVELRTLRMLKASIVQAPCPPPPDTAARVVAARRNVVSSIASALSSASDGELLRMQAGKLERVSRLVELGVTGPEEDRKLEGDLEQAFSGAEPTDANERAILQELLAHPSFDLVATPRFARDLHRTQTATQKTLPEVIAALRAAAVKTATPEHPTTLRRKLVSFVQNQRPIPPAPPSAPAPPPWGSAG